MNVKAHHCPFILQSQTDAPVLMLCDLPWGLNLKIRQKKKSFNKEINFLLKTYNPYTNSVLEQWWPSGGPRTTGGP